MCSSVFLTRSRRLPAESPIDIRHVGGLNYCRQTVHEAMRLFPPTPGIGRLPNTAMTVAGMRISTRTRIHISIFALRRNVRLWDNPTAFDPDRFAADRVKDLFAIRLFAVRSWAARLHRGECCNDRGDGDPGLPGARLSLSIARRAQAKAGGEGDTAPCRRHAAPDRGVRKEPAAPNSGVVRLRKA
jgi:Cytochrome P450